MSKNYIIILMFALWLLTFFYFSCGKKQQPNTYVEDSLKNAIKLKADTIATLQVQVYNLNSAFTALQAQKQNIKYETKTIWQTKYITDSIIYAYSDSETVRKFMQRYYPN